MNRVYKVIWSKAKHCYVVTSEIAKGYGKSAGSKGVKALLSGLVALSIAMGGYGLAGAVFVESKNAEDGVYNTPVYTTEEVYTKEETGDKFATKDELNAKANAADVENTYAKTADVANTYVNKTKAEVTFLTVDGDVDAHGNLKVGNGNFKVDGSTGDVTTGSAAIGGALTVDGDTEIDGDLGVTGNLFAGGYTETDAKAALNADGSIKGAEGKFTVGTDGKVTAASGKIGTVDITSDGALTGMKSLGVENINAGGTITGNKLTDGVASLQAGNLNTTGNINAHDINAHDIVATGDISGKAISGTTITGTTITGTSLNTQGGDISGGAITGTTITGTSLNTQNGEINGGDIKSGGIIIAKGKITGNGLDAGSGAISGGSLSVTGAMEGNSLTLKGGNLNAGSGTITTTGDINGNNINTTGKITTKDLEVTGGLKTDHITLGSEDLNQTDINKGKVTSKIHEISGAVEYTAESIFNKDGSSITVRTNEGRVDSTGSSTVGSQIITQYLGNNAVPGGNNVTRRMVRNDNGTFSMVDTAVNGKDKYSIVSQNAEERKVTVTEGTKTLTVTKNLTDGIVSETNGGAGKTVTLTQGMDGTYKVETDGTSTEDIGGKKIENYKDALETTVAKDETHYVKGNQSNKVDGTLTETVKGKVTEDYQDALETTVAKDETHYVKGNQSSKVDGTLTETVKGKVTEDYQDALETTVAKDETHYVKGNQSNKVDGTLTETVKGKVTENYQDALETTVTGDSSLSATNIKNKASTSITNQIGNGSAVKSEMTADGITNMAEGGTIYNKSKDILNEASGDIINWADGEIGNVATKITNITGKNTVISDNDGTTFENEDAKTPFVKGGEVNTKITGNKVENGKVLTDDLTVRGTSEFVGRADFRNEVYVDENLTVAKETRTDTLYVDHDGYVGGNLYVEGNIETHDAVLSADSRQVVTGRQLYQTNERVDRLDNRIKKVGANAAALAALRPGDFNPDDKFSIAAGFGSYRNANAAALGLFYRPNENVLLSLGTSFGDGENMVNAGVSVKFGRGKSMAERRKEMADEVSSMRDEMRSQDERIAELEEMLKKQSELIEKLSKES